MELIVLGTSSGTATKTRSVSGSALKINKSTTYLLDAGEGILGRLQAAKVKVNSIRKILITHAHQDHYLGLFALVSEMAMCNKHKELEIFLPNDLMKFVVDFLKLSTKYEGFYNFVTLRFLDYSYPKDGFDIVRLNHNGTDSYGFVFQFKQKQKLDIEKLKSNLIYPKDYRWFANDPDYLLPPKEKTLIYFGDNEGMSIVDKTLQKYRNDDVVFYHEGTYTSDMRDKILLNKDSAHGHTSIYDITKTVAKNNNNSNIQFILSHFSPRLSVEMIKDDIALNCKDVIIAYDGLIVNLD